RNKFAHYLQAFAVELDSVQEDARDVSSRARQATGETAGDRIRLEIQHDEGNRFGQLHERASCRRADADDQVDLRLDQLGRHGTEALVIRLVRDAALDDDRLPDEVTPRAQTLRER